MAMNMDSRAAYIGTVIKALTLATADFSHTFAFLALTLKAEESLGDLRLRRDIGVVLP